MLPRSAGGWQLDDAGKTGHCEARVHWAELSPRLQTTLLRVGGFDARLGPGGHMLSPGEDTEIQERLLAAMAFAAITCPTLAMRHWVRDRRAQRSSLPFIGPSGTAFIGASARLGKAGFFPRGG